MSQVQALNADWVRIKTTKQQLVANCIPNTHVWAEHVDVPFTQSNAEVLAKLGIAAPSPILRDYHWPAPFEPMPHQLQIANFMVTNPRGFIFSEPGTGKTLSAIWALDYLMSIGMVKRVLVVCPLSIMEPAWGQDLFQSVTASPYAVLQGTKERRLKLLAQGCKWNIINFDGIEVIYNELLATGFDAIVIDESRAYANPSTDRFRKIKPIATRAKYVWGLTGTPTPLSPMDAYGQAKLVVPDTTPMSKGAWQDRTMYKLTAFRYVPRVTAWDDTHKLLQPAIRFAKKDVLKDLPPVVYSYRFVDLTPAQKKYYMLLKDEAVATNGTNTISAVHAGALMLKLMQVASGCVYDDQHVALEFDVAARIKEVKDIIEETPRGVLVFAPFLHTVQMLEKHLKPMGFETITGDVSAPRRTEIIGRLQAGEIKGILAIPQTMSHGITATAADTTIWFSCPPSSEVYIQACNRMDRPGQKHAMRIVHLYGSNVEKARYDKIKEQEASQNSLLDMYQKFISEKSL